MSEHERLAAILRLIAGTPLENLMSAVALGAMAGTCDAMAELPQYRALLPICKDIRALAAGEVRPMVLANNSGDA